MNKKEKEKMEAVEHLKTLVKDGDTVYTVLRYVSSSGMSRRIDLFKIEVDKHTGKPYMAYLSEWAARAMGRRLDRKGGIVITGCGMDMGFALVDSLQAVVFGYDIKEDDNGCKSYHLRGQLRQEWI